MGEGAAERKKYIGGLYNQQKLALRIAFLLISNNLFFLVYIRRRSLTGDRAWHLQVRPA